MSQIEPKLNEIKVMDQGNQHGINPLNENTAMESYERIFNYGKHTLSENLSSNLKFRSFLQLIGQLGPIGAFATVIDLAIAAASEKRRKIQEQEFLHMVAAKIDQCENPKIFMDNLRKNPEVALDFFLYIKEAAQEAFSKEKRDRFANILLQAAFEDISWAEAKEYVRILVSLEDHDIAVLQFSSTVPNCDDNSFDGLPVVTIAEESQPMKGPIFLQWKFKNLPPFAIFRTCSRLIAEGLFVDSGLGRIGTKSMEYFQITDAGRRFLVWISEKQ